MNHLDALALQTTAVRAAQAGALALAPFAGNRPALEISSKQANDFVTQADVASERAIASVIAADWPAHKILGEELSATLALAGDPTWIVDPLDGTTNFIHGFPVYSVSVACAVGGQIVAGVVLDPTRDELFRAARGHGAWLGDNRLAISQPNGLDGALVATGFPFRRLHRLEPFLSAFRAVVLRTAGVRRAGSAALDLAYVAAGRVDGFWEEGLGSWDMAAGTLLIEEAGGVVSDFDNTREFLKTGSVVAGCASLHAELREIVVQHQG